MEAMARDLWTDERLDELNVRIDRGFEWVQREFIAIRTEMRTEFASLRGEMGQIRGEMGQIRGEMGQIRGEMGQIHESLNGMQRMMLQLFIPLIVTLVFGFAGMIVALLAQP